MLPLVFDSAIWLTLGWKLLGLTYDNFFPSCETFWAIFLLKADWGYKVIQTDNYLEIRDAGDIIFHLKLHLLIDNI